MGRKIVDLADPETPEIEFVELSWPWEGGQANSHTSSRFLTNAITVELRLPTLLRLEGLCCYHKARCLPECVPFRSLLADGRSARARPLPVQQSIRGIP